MCIISSLGIRMDVYQAVLVVQRQENYFDYHTFTSISKCCISHRYGSGNWLGRLVFLGNLIWFLNFFCSFTQHYSIEHDVTTD